MEHIKRQYGQDVNYMRITGEELEQLEPFLKGLGVRVRKMVSWKEGETWYHDIQAENPYKSVARGHDREFADRMMSDEMIAVWKR